MSSEFIKECLGGRTPQSLRNLGAQVRLDGKLVDPELADMVTFILGEEAPSKENGGDMLGAEPRVVLKNIIVEADVRLPTWYAAFINQTLPITGNTGEMIVCLQAIIQSVKDGFLTAKLHKVLPFLGEEAKKNPQAPTRIPGGILHPELSEKVNFEIVPEIKYIFDPHAPINMGFFIETQWRIAVNIQDENLPNWFKKFLIQIKSLIFSESERSKIISDLEGMIRDFCDN